MNRTGIIRKSVKLVTFAGIQLMLSVPLLQDLFELKEEIYPLNGSFTHARDTALSMEAWFSGGYQGQKEKFLRDSFGLHNYYVRLNGELNFRLFKKANAVYVVVGRDNYLYETGYINAYFGDDFVGKEKIDSLVDMVAYLQDTLGKARKLLLPVIAAGKASYYPEYIPKEYLRPARKSNYLYFRERAKHKKVDVLDFNAYFRAQKHKSRYPLYPQYGIHWSSYGAVMAFDSIVRYAENKLDVELPDIVFDTPVVSTNAVGNDNDIIEGMNVLIKPSTFPMADTRWTVQKDSARHGKLKLLVIADSFWWYIYSTGLPGGIFQESRFWFYNEAAYPESFTSPKNVRDLDYKKAIREADVILILHAESTLGRFGDGFVQMCYDVYKPLPTKDKH